MIKVRRILIALGLNFLSWLAFMIIVIVLYFSFIRHAQMTWGASSEDINRPMMGDELHVNPEFNSTYELFTSDPVSEKYMMLVYKTIGDNDKDQDGNSQYSVGDVVQDGLWGLTAYVGGSATSAQFNWEYSASGGWGTVTYLLDSGGDFVFLDDPVRFNAITATNYAGDQKNLVLQFDGWMMGLPDLYRDLEKNGWVMTDELSDKIINLPAGTRGTDAAAGTDYVLKPLEISQFLSAVTHTDGLSLPNIAQGKNVDLSTVPDFVEHGMGGMPQNVTIKYSEGMPIEEIED